MINIPHTKKTKLGLYKTATNREIKLYRKRIDRKVTNVHPKILKLAEAIKKEKIEKDVNAVSLIIHLLLFRLGYSYEFERYLFNYSIKKSEKQEIINEIVFAIKTDNLDSIATIVPEFIERENKRRKKK